jgi:TetR/AcrR family transcriptional repressor of bet genes
MGRPSNREKRRAEFVDAFARVLGDHGYAGATVAKVAAEAGVAPGLVHHHFRNKEELSTELLAVLIGRFRSRVRHYREDDPDAPPLEVYADAALKLDEKADTIAARCWVGLLAEAVRTPELFRRVRRHLDSEIGSLRQLSEGRLDDHQASAVMAFVLGSLVFGAFAPRKAAGFAAPALKIFIRAVAAG